MSKVIIFAALATVCVIGTFLVLSNKSETTNFNDTSDYDAFVHWQNKFGKRFTSEEKVHRFDIFKSNLHLVNAHNSQKNNTYTMETNQFADLTNDEFKELYLTYTPIQLLGNEGRVHLSTMNLAGSIDWREKGVVGPIKDQKSCGSCWAFSAIGALESAYALKTGSVVSLSEQQLVDCSGSFGNQGCNGGLMTSSYEYLKQTPIQKSADYPYTARDGKCVFNATKALFKIPSYTQVPANNQDQLAAAINKQPVAVAVDASNWSMYSKGIFSDCNTNLNHGVTAVGYGTEGTTDFWIVRNSWGAWGESGHIRVKKTNGAGKGTCGIAMDACYPQV